MLKSSSSRNSANERASLHKFARVCAICSEELLLCEEEIACLSCGHTFHYSCIHRWMKVCLEGLLSSFQFLSVCKLSPLSAPNLQKKSVCPLCRKRTTRSSIRKLFFSEGEAESVKAEEGNDDDDDEQINYENEVTPLPLCNFVYEI